MTTIHTSGPWMADKHPKGHCGIFQRDHAHQIAEVLDRNTPAEMVDANAQLIAAAPDLLAALETLMEGYGGMDGPEGWSADCRTANAALEKARGIRGPNDPAQTRRAGA